MSDMSILPGKGAETFSLFETVLARPEPQLVGRVLKYSERPGVTALRLRLVSSSFAYRDSFVMEMNRYVSLKLRDQDSFAKIQQSFLWKHLNSFSLLYRWGPCFSDTEVSPVTLVDALKASRPGVSIQSLRLHDFLCITLWITKVTDEQLSLYFGSVKELHIDSLLIQVIDSEESIDSFRRLLLSCAPLEQLTLGIDRQYPQDLRDLLDPIIGDDFDTIFGSLQRLRFVGATPSDHVAPDLRRFLRKYDIGESLGSIRTWGSTQMAIRDLSDEDLIAIFGDVNDVSNDLFTNSGDQDSFIRLLKVIKPLKSLQLKQSRYDKDDHGLFMSMSQVLTDEDRVRLLQPTQKLSLRDVNHFSRLHLDSFFRAFQSLKFIRLDNCQVVLDFLQSLDDKLFAQIAKSLKGLTLYKMTIDQALLDRFFSVAPQLVLEIKKEDGESIFFR